MKKCSKCKETRDFVDFYKNRARHDGFCNICKFCEKTKKKYPEARAIYGKKFRNSEKGKKYLTEYHSSYYQKNKDIYAARGAKWRKENPERMKELWNRCAKKENTKQRHKAQEAKRRSIKMKAMPKWSDIKKIQEFYKNCPEGYHVDHIIPLNNPLVCGLHVIENLQYLTAQENFKKNNKFEVKSV